MMVPGSTAPVHWGLLSIDRSQSTHMWAGTNYGGATPGDTYKSQMAVLANCAWQKANGCVDRCSSTRTPSTRCTITRPTGLS